MSAEDKARLLICGIAALLAVLVRWVVAAKADTLYVSTSGGSLNARFAPGGEVIAQLADGEAVDVQSISGGWAAIIHGGDTLYVSADYLTDADKPTGDYKVTANGRVRVRKTPGGKVIGYRHNGDRVTVMRWATADDGTSWGCTADGYISADCLEDQP